MEGILGRIMATVLGLIALGGVVLLMSTASDSSRISQSGQDLGTLATNTRSQFQQSGTLYANFSNANASSLISSGVIPPDMVKGGAIVDAWNDPVTIAPTTPAGMVANSAFSVQIGGGSLSAESCAKLVTALTGYYSLTVGGATFSTANPPDPTTAGPACSSGSTVMTLIYQ